MITTMLIMMMMTMIADHDHRRQYGGGGGSGAKGLPHLPLQLHHLLLLLTGVLVPSVAVPQEPTVRAVSAQVAVAHLFAQGTLL